MDRGCAEIYYYKRENAIKAAEGTDGIGIFGKNIKVTFYETKKEDDDLSGRNIHINRDDRNSIWDRIKLNK